MKSRLVKDEKGSALIYILIAIALLALLTTTFMESSSQQTQSQNSFKMVSELSNQAELIRAAVQECVLYNPGGDINTIPAVNTNNPYPISPKATYFTSNCPADPADTDINVTHLRCPGKPGDNACHLPIFTAASGKFLPQPPALFGAWQWYNGADGVFFWIGSSKSDAFIQTALEKLDEQYAGCEADTINASASDIVMSSDDADIKCPSGSRCFRLWMVRKAGSKPTDAACP